LLGTAGGTVMMIWATTPPAAAGVVAVLAVALGWFVPALAFRLSGLRLPLLPVNAEQLQEDIEPHSGGDVRARSQVADSYLTALYLAIGSTCTVCLTAALSSSAWSSTVFAVVLCVLLLSQSRKLGGMWQRFALVLPGGYGAMLLCVAITLRGDAGQRVVVLGAVLALAATMTVANWTVPRRRLLPYWGRIADLIESAAAISLVPLAVLALGVFGYLRGMGG
jgi:type VII secretion integral membrane protein EccD